jgi:hypothetical protein
MANAVKKTVSLPADIAREIEDQARAEGKSVSAIVQDALRQARTARLRGEFADIRSFWSRKARERGIFTERDLARYLRP